MPTTKKRFYCIKCGSRTVASKMISIACVKTRFNVPDNFKIHMCHKCAIRFRDFLNGMNFPESVAVVRTPKESVALVGTPFDADEIEPGEQTEYFCGLNIEV